MAEVDTSSYPKAALPVSPLETAGKIGALKQQSQQIESGGLAIDRQKIELANKALDVLGTAVTSLGPNATKDDYKAIGLNVAKAFNLPPQALQSWNERIDAAKSPQDFYNQAVTAIGDHQAAINYHLGNVGSQSNGQQVTPVVTSNKPGFGVRPIAAPIQIQPPPTSETTDNNPTLANGQPNPNYGARSMLGPQAPQLPAGALPVAGGIPGQFRPARPSMAPAGPMNNPAIAGPSSNFGGNVVGATAEAPTFRDRFSSAFKPAGPVTSLPPGAGEALEIGAKAGANAAAIGRDRAARYNRDIFPLTQAIPALEKLGTKGTGPGTEAINNLKSFVLSNVPGIKESDFNGTVADYDKAKKYLTDFVNQTGNSGTNDKLAAAFAGNPSVGISNAAAVDVAKSALSLRRMQQAEDLAFERSGLPDRDRQKFSVKFNSAQDPRAYGIDMMGKDKLQKLLKNMTKKERDIFNNSVVLAHQQGIIK